MPACPRAALAEKEHCSAPAKLAASAARARPREQGGQQVCCLVRGRGQRCGFAAEQQQVRPGQRHAGHRRITAGARTLWKALLIEHFDPRPSAALTAGHAACSPFQDVCNHAGVQQEALWELQRHAARPRLTDAPHRLRGAAQRGVAGGRQLISAGLGAAGMRMQGLAAGEGAASRLRAASSGEAAGQAA